MDDQGMVRSQSTVQWESDFSQQWQKNVNSPSLIQAIKGKKEQKTENLFLARCQIASGEVNPGFYLKG